MRFHRGEEGQQESDYYQLLYTEQTFWKDIPVENFKSLASRCKVWAGNGPGNVPKLQKDERYRCQVPHCQIIQYEYHQWDGRLQAWPFEPFRLDTGPEDWRTGHWAFSETSTHGVWSRPSPKASSFQWLSPRRWYSRVNGSQVGGLTTLN